MSNQYFDLIARGSAEIKRFRQVTPQGAKPYYAMTLAIHRSDANHQSTTTSPRTYIDCTVCGPAIKMIEESIAPLFESGDADVTVGFSIGDINLKEFVHKNGDLAGIKDESPKARLFDIEWYTECSLDHAIKHGGVPSLSLTGTGFVNFLKLIKPERSDPYYSFSVAAYHGQADDEGKVPRTYFSSTVNDSADEMMQRILSLYERDDDPSIMIGFESTDFCFVPFEYQKPEKRGELGRRPTMTVSNIKWFRVDGETHYSQAEVERRRERERTLRNSAALTTTGDSVKTNGNGETILVNSHVEI